MSALPKVYPNSTDSPDTQNVWVEYDEASDTVSVSPESVNKGTTVCFKSSKGKLKVAFLSPTGKETDILTDSDECNLIVGGSYHFKCYFTVDGQEQSPSNGGVIEVLPQKP